MIKSIFAPDGAFQTRGEVKEVSGGVEVGGCYYAVPPFVLSDDPAPVVPVPKTVPQKVTRRQAKQALLLAGLLDKVQPAISAIVDPVQRAMIQIEWDDSQEFERNRASLVALGTALGMTPSQLDDLFITAAKL